MKKQQRSSNRFRLIAALAGVVVILAVIAVPALAATNPENKLAEEFVEALGFDGVEEFRAFFGLEEDDGEGDYADSSSSIDADVLAQELGYDDGDDLARALGLDNEEQLEAYLEESGSLNELAQALGYTNARELARELGLDNREELATILGLEDDNDEGELESAASLDSEIEQEAESGDVSMSAEVSSSGDNSNQSAPVLQAANTGNNQNAQQIVQQGSEAEDIEVEGSSIEVSPELDAQSQQEIQQAAAAGE